MPPSEPSATVDFVVAGDPGQVTGGYIYDRRIVAELRALGADVRVHGLAGTFPQADGVAREEARRLLGDVREGATVVIDGLALPAFHGLMKALSERAPVLGLIHHPLHLEGGLGPAERERLRYREAEALRHCRGAVVTSEATRADVAALGLAPESVVVVEPGTQACPGEPARPAERAQDAVNLLCVASVVERKGHPDLVAALARIRHLAWRLECVGSLGRDPGTAAQVRAAIRQADLGERIELAGEVPPADLARYYSRADVFVLASRHEGYGMALAEAMSYGIPVVSTCAGAIPDTVPAAAGLLVPPGDVEALADALREVVQNAGLRQRMADAARRIRRRGWPEAGRQFLHAIERFGAREA